MRGVLATPAHQYESRRDVRSMSYWNSKTNWRVWHLLELWGFSFPPHCCQNHRSSGQLWSVKFATVPNFQASLVQLSCRRADAKSHECIAFWRSFWPKQWVQVIPNCRQFLHRSHRCCAVSFQSCCNCCDNWTTWDKIIFFMILLIIILAIIGAIVGECYSRQMKKISTTRMCVENIVYEIYLCGFVLRALPLCWNKSPPKQFYQISFQLWSCTLRSEDTLDSSRRNYGTADLLAELQTYSFVRVTHQPSKRACSFPELTSVTTNVLNSIEFQLFVRVLEALVQESLRSRQQIYFIPIVCAQQFLAKNLCRWPKSKGQSNSSRSQWSPHWAHQCPRPGLPRWSHRNHDLNFALQCGVVLKKNRRDFDVRRRVPVICSDASVLLLYQRVFQRKLSCFFRTLHRLTVFWLTKTPHISLRFEATRTYVWE